jgi:hypothetical protein
MKHTNTLCEQNAKYSYVTAGGAYSNHWALKGREAAEETTYNLRTENFARPRNVDDRFLKTGS